MKTEDIRKMAQAWQQVQEASKLDPVNPSELKGTHAQRKDKDIDNDGDVDKSDEYLHNRRKTIKHAMKKEEVELDEVSKNTLKSYISKATGELDADWQAARKGKPGMPNRKVSNRFTGIEKAKERMKESVELDEVSDKMLDRYRQKAFADQPAGDDGSDKYRKRKFGRDLAFAKQTGRAKVLATKESADLDEAVEVRHDRYMRSHGKKASGGTGSWMFTHKAMGDVDHKNEKEVYSAPSGKFSDAKKAAQQWAKKHGHSTVYVMEEVELNEAIIQGSKEHLKKLQGMLDKAKPGSAEHSQIRGAITSMFGKQHIPVKHRNVKPDVYEEVEQLDELSPNTLRSYAAKSYNQANTLAKQSLSDQPKSVEKASKDAFKRRSAGIKAAGRRLGSDEMKKIHKDVVGEAVEQIDEISKSTLGSYAKKALHRGEIAAHMYKSDTDEMGKIANKRLTGAKKAVDRIAPKAAATRIKTNIDKAKEAARNRSTDKDDEGKAYYTAQKGIAKVREAADLNTANVKKAVRHDCATHVEHAEWGKGQPIKGEHTIVETADGEGYVTHYDVMFEHGIEKNVAVEDLKILASESHMHANKRKKMKESNEWPVYARILEKRDEHTKGATAAEPIDSKASQGEKDFVAKHGGLDGNDSGIDGAKAAEATAKAATAGVKTAPKRPADATIGDKTMPKA
jgi:hypothetical protein